LDGYYFTIPLEASWFDFEQMRMKNLSGAISIPLQ
jgi:hypothetical protein